MKKKPVFLFFGEEQQNSNLIPKDVTCKEVWLEQIPALFSSQCFYEHFGFVYCDSLMKIWKFMECSKNDLTYERGENTVVSKREE